MVLTRDAIKNGFIDRMIAERGGLPDRWSEAQIVDCARRILAEAPAKGDLWVFGYGSLMWNPAVHVAEQRPARLAGYHRRFCLWTSLGRGSTDCPGLLHGLEPGGACRGVALRIERQAAATEIDILVRREMVSGAYAPRWLKVAIDGMHERVPALVFLMNRRHARYSGRLSDKRIVAAIAEARGPLGACRDYLDNTVKALEALGISDRNVERIRRKLGRAPGSEDSRVSNHSR